MRCLPDVTLCCVDTLNHALALRALARCMQHVRFAQCLFITADLPNEAILPADLDIIPIAPLHSRRAYSEFMLKRLGAHVATSHVLVVQWDGYVVNPDAWSPDFLACDYLGATWFWHHDGLTIGNGGFSLRSRRLLAALEDPRVQVEDAEDEAIGRTCRRMLERDHAIRFGDEALADRFSFEAAYPVGRPFGFHGLFNLWRIEAQEEIARLARSFPDAIARSPQLGQLLRNCAATGQWQATQALAERVLSADPNAQEAQGLLERANAELRRPPVVGRNEPCPCGSGRKYKQCHGAIEQGPGPAPADTIDAQVAAALAVHQRGDLAAAESAYRAVLARVPEHPIATHYLGVVHYQQKRWHEALPLIERSAAAVVDEPEFQNNLGLVLAALDRHHEAIEAYRRTLARKPDHAVAWNNLGLALTGLNRVPEAIGAYRQSIVHAPAFGEAHWNLALALLVTGEYAEGWREYEWRLALSALGSATAGDVAKRWDGTIAPGKRLILRAEQGLGDAIQFVRFASPLAQRGMIVDVQAPSVLHALLSTVPGVSGVHAPVDSPAVDAELPLLSVARVLDVRDETIPAAIPYLRACAERRARIRSALGGPAEERRIGLAWKGNPAHANDHRRSVDFGVLRPFFRQPRTRWFSLQAGSTVGPPLHEWSARGDFDDLAALVSELDLVISVDTSVTHLAGALGRPTWLLLPFAPDWRWGLQGEGTRWYPTMRLFRQRQPGDWSEVVSRVVTALEQFCALDERSRAVEVNETLVPPARSARPSG